MDKYRPPRQPDELTPGLDGPDYVALVIEWDDLAGSLEDTAESAMATPPQMGFSDADQIWNRVDEASMESFPASDPPAWGSSHAVAEAAAPEDISEEVTSPLRSGTQMSGLRRFVLGLAAVVALISMIEGLRRVRRHA
jgi:hypothetical protein